MLWLLMACVDSMPSEADDPLPEVEITSDAETFEHLLRPTGKFDETSLGGFNYWISSREGDFTANDQYLNVGDETLETNALAADLGTVEVLSGQPQAFEITHMAGQHFRFSLSADGVTSTLCWGEGCPETAIAAVTLEGAPPLTAFNGLQLQFRAQDVAGSSVTVTDLALSGLRPTNDSEALFDGTVTPETPSSLPLDPPGRAGQWILGSSLAQADWTLSGTVVLSRPDEALEDRNKVRLAVDFVEDLRLDTTVDGAE